MLYFYNVTFRVTGIRLNSFHFLIQIPTPYFVSMCKCILDLTMQDIMSKSGEPCVGREGGGVGRQKVHVVSHQ